MYTHTSKDEIGFLYVKNVPNTECLGFLDGKDADCQLSAGEERGIVKVYVYTRNFRR